MKKIFKYLLTLPLAALALSCGKQEIVFDHEKPGFDVQEGKILIEAIVPTTTTDSDEIYIAGPFAGGDSLAVCGNEAYKLAHSTVISQKWGVYLDPASFKDGKTLEDGFWFISYKEGRERSGKGEETVHTLSAQAGQSYNVYITSWKSRFESSEEDDEGFPEHDGVRIYIIDQTGWDAITLYQWGDQNNLGGDWPGAQVTGTFTYKETKTTYKYFDFTDEIYGLSQNLIFNNNGGGTQLKDYAITFEEGVTDYFLLVTADGVSEAENPDAKPVIPVHDGVRVYANDQTGWDAITLYQWGDQNNLGGDWPGAQVAGTEMIKGVEYVYFEYGEEVYGLNQNLIFNNNGGGTQLKDYALTFEEGVQDYFFDVTVDGVTAVDIDGGTTPDPVDPDEPDESEVKITVYVDDQTGWEALALYQWGDENNLGGSWPGMQVTGTKDIDGVTYKYFEYGAEVVGKNQNLIFNNNGNGIQLSEYALTFAEGIYEYYFQITGTGVTFIK